MTSEPLLVVRDLRVNIGGLEAVRGVDFEMSRQSRLGIVGESGAGKSLTALALLGLLPEGAHASGEVVLNGKNLIGLPEGRLAKLRGSIFGVVFQDPMTSLNPVHRVGDQISETLIRNTGASKKSARDHAIELLERVGLPEPAAKSRAYPHELSGGQRQRVLIAMAIACKPRLLIADEPTTALDVTIQADVLHLLGRLIDEEEMSLLLITHDLPVIASQCDEVLVMYGGRVMERGPAGAVFSEPHHPYTAGLIRSQPNPPGGTLEKARRLPTIPGVVPPLGEFPSGCPFRTRCERGDDQCQNMPPAAHNRSTYWCWHPIGAGRDAATVH